MMPAEDQGAVHQLFLEQRRHAAAEEGGSPQPPARRAPSLRMEVDEDVAFGASPGLTRCLDGREWPRGELGSPHRAPQAGSWAQARSWTQAGPWA